MRIASKEKGICLMLKRCLNPALVFWAFWVGLSLPGTAAAQTQDEFAEESEAGPFGKSVTTERSGQPGDLRPDMPLNAGISLYRDPETENEIVFRLIMPPVGPQTPVYQGKVDWYSDNYVAGGVEVPLSTG